jgi:hypothetical protein
VAGFRNGRGRDNRASQQRPQARQQQWPPAGGGAPHGDGGPYGPGARSATGEPEYFGRSPQYGGGGPSQPYGQQQPYGQPQSYGQGQQYGRQPHDGPDAPGARRPHDRPADRAAGGPAAYAPPPEPPPYHPFPSADPYANDNNAGHTQVFRADDPYGDGHTYRAGAAPAPAGPRLGWRDLLPGMILRPKQTFLQMRDYPMWGPALIVSFVYGALAVFGFDASREDVLHATTASTAIVSVVVTAVVFVIGSLILGVVTHTLARQLGGDGSWQPTVGLSMLLMAVTDAPRLLFAAFLGGGNGFVQVLGWLTWVGACFLFTLMVSTSHDLPRLKALGASAIQLAALLSLLKLGTI